MGCHQDQKPDGVQIAQDRQAYADWFGEQFSSENTAQNVGKMIHAAIKYELSDKQRAYFISYYLEGKSIKEIGEIYDVDKSTISRTLKRSRNRLKRVLKYSSPQLMRIFEQGDDRELKRTYNKGERHGLQNAK